MKKDEIIFGFLIFILFVVILTYSNEIIAAEPVKVKVGLSAMDTGYLPVHVAIEKGIFKQEGLDVSKVFFKGDTETAQGIISGDIQFGFIGSTVPVQMKEEKVDLKIIASLCNYLVYKLYTQPNIKTTNDLNGKIFGFSKYGSISEFVTLEIVDNFKIKDAKLLQIGSHPARLAAMETKQIHATILDAPFTLEAERKGFNMLVNVPEMLPEFVKDLVVAKGDYIEKNRAITKSFLKGYVKGIRYTKANKAEAVALDSKILNISKDISAVSYDDIFKAWPDDGMPTSDGIQRLINRMYESKKISRVYKVEEVANLKILAEALAELGISK